MSDLILGNFQKIITLIFLVMTSIIIRQTLILCGQKWVETFSHTATILTLPVITYVVTSVISGNIALSLGMVGALSIVRFRNPVRSSFELTVYFFVITMGISASVSLKWLGFLVAAIVSILALIFFIDKIMIKKFKKSWFKTSFSEGNSLSTLDVQSKKEIKYLSSDRNLMSVFRNVNGFEYRLASSDVAELMKIYNAIKDKKETISCRLLK